MLPPYEEGVEVPLGQSEATCTVLDTIEEARESSSLSGNSNDLDTLSATESRSSLEEAAPAPKDREMADKKLLLHWTHEEEEDDDEEALTENPYPVELTPDVDSGWAWVVLASIFTIFCINSGLLASTGIYYVQMLKEFGQSRSYTAWMGSLMNAFFMLAGPLCSVLIQRYGCRASIMFGGVLMCVGYLLSSVANSLPLVFFTYGVVVACGMNFVYSGQIIALAQYFVVKHSFATSLSMIGIGVGMFSCIRLIDFIINEYGWRGSFVFCAGFSLQLCVLGALVFPISPPPEGDAPSGPDALKQNFSDQSLPYSPPADGRIVHKRLSVLNRSVSSLRLSIGAGYLSSSFNNLNSGDNRSGNVFFTSNQHSFCSKGSQTAGGVRSNQHSFSQYHNGDIPVGFLPFLRSNQHSFCSRGSSFGIRSNPHSFSNKNSQNDLHHNNFHPHVFPSVRDVDPKPREKSTTFYMSDSRLGFPPIKEDEDESPRRILVTNKIIRSLKGIFMSDSNMELMRDPCFWLLNISMLVLMLGTITMFVIYQDFTEFLGVGEYFSFGMSCIGIGDIVGRIIVGVFASYKTVNPVIVYAVAMLFCGVTIGLHVIATSGTTLLVIGSFFGFFYGQQNVLITIVPSILFGREKLVTVFGYVLFFAGLGALVGSPLAGLIVDCTGSYLGVIGLSVFCCLIAGFCMLCCHFICLRREKQSENLSSNV